MKTRSIRLHMALSIGLPVIGGFTLFLVLFHLMFGSLSALLIKETEALHLETYKKELRTATELAVGLVEGVYQRRDLNSQEKLEQARELLRPLRFDGDGYFYAYENGSGKNLIHGSNRKLEDTNLWDLQDPDKTQYIIRELDKTAAEGSMFLRFYWSKPGTQTRFPKLGTAARVPGSNIWLGTGVYIDEVQQSMATMKDKIDSKTAYFQYGSYFLIFIVLFLMGVSIALISRKLSSPVIVLRDILHESGGRDLTLRAEYRDKRKSRELEELYDAINAMFDSFSSLIRDVRKSIHEAGTLSDNLEQAGSLSKENFDNVHSSIGELQKQSLRLSDASGEAARANREFSAFIEQVDGLINEQVSSLEESSAAVEQMIHSVDNLSGFAKQRLQSAEHLANTSEKGKQEMDRAIQHIRSIADSAREIEAMTGLIDEIAERTSLLAMNAAIEAAHAGSSGGGFAVIAQEIRSLSESSSANARKISDSLSAISGQIADSEESTLTSGAYFQEMVQGIRDVASGFRDTQGAIDEIATGGSQVKEALAELRDMGSRVAQASADVREMVFGIRELLKQMDEGSDTSTHFLNRLSQKVEDSVEEMAELSRQGKENNENLKELEESLSTFFTD